MEEVDLWKVMELIGFQLPESGKLLYFPKVVNYGKTKTLNKHMQK